MVVCLKSGAAGLLQVYAGCTLLEARRRTSAYFLVQPTSPRSGGKEKYQQRIVYLFGLSLWSYSSYPVLRSFTLSYPCLYPCPYPCPLSPNPSACNARSLPCPITSIAVNPNWWIRTFDWLTETLCSDPIIFFYIFVLPNPLTRVTVSLNWSVPSARLKDEVSIVLTHFVTLSLLTENDENKKE